MSGFRMDLDLDTEDLQSQLDDTVENWSEHRRAMLLGVSERMVGLTKREVPTSSSRLQGTIRTEETPGGGVHVVAGGEQGVDYTLPVLHGSEPHAPGSPDPDQNLSLSRWADRVGYPGGFESIYWSIFHYGTEEHDFVTGPLQQTQSESSGIMTAILKERGVLE